MTVALIGYYTITPTHCGTGQASNGVDLPIARESHSGHPILPATSIKGSLRDHFEKSLGKGRAELTKWFGPELEPKAGSGGAALQAGSILFGEGRLLAFPVRALHTAFCYITCPLILERFERDLYAYGLEGFWSAAPSRRDGGEPWPDAAALVRASVPTPEPLVLEDLAFDASEVAPSKVVDALGSVLGQLLPENEKATQKRLASQLVVLRDDYFGDLVRRTTPVQARVRLNEQKTTTGNGGNLWYEENLPPDALLASFVAERRQTRNISAESAGTRSTESAGTGSAGSEGTGSASSFLEQLGTQMSRPLQIGGNETVGQGVCLWHRGAQADG